jgi:hypothetical protein
VKDVDDEIVEIQELMRAYGGNLSKSEVDGELESEVTQEEIDNLRKEEEKLQKEQARLMEDEQDL